jgi:hypothetical protein
MVWVVGVGGIFGGLVSVDCELEGVGSWI